MKSYVQVFFVRLLLKKTMYCPIDVVMRIRTLVI